MGYFEPWVTTPGCYQMKTNHSKLMWQNKTNNLHLLSLPCQTGNNMYIYMNKNFPLLTCGCIQIAWNKRKDPWLVLVIKETGPHFTIKTFFPGTDISIIKLKRSWDHHIFMMGIPKLAGWHLYIEMVIHETYAVFPLTHNRCEVVISWWSPLLPKISIYATKCESILEKSGIFIHLQSKYCINFSC